MNDDTPTQSVRPITGEAIRLQSGSRRVLDIDRIVLGQAQCCALVGPNGAGKSLLIRTLCGLPVPVSGVVRWAGREPDSARRHRVGLILQQPVLFRRSALDNLVHTLTVALNSDSKTARATAVDALQSAGLQQVAHNHAHQLSGGERQRLALVRALLLKPDVLFLDEATAHVDNASTALIESQLQAAMREGLAVVLVTHDMHQARRLADQVCLMHDGMIVEQATATEFFDKPRNPVVRQWLAGGLLL